jgi:hypothetical protein
VAIKPAAPGITSNRNGNDRSLIRTWLIATATALLDPSHPTATLAFDRWYRLIVIQVVKHIYGKRT